MPEKYVDPKEVKEQREKDMLAAVQLIAATLVKIEKHMGKLEKN